MSKVSDRMERVKALRAKQAVAEKEAAADEAQLRVFEEQRDGLYSRCRELNVEPQDIKAEISKRTEAIDADLNRIESRFADLKGEE